MQKAILTFFISLFSLLHSAQPAAVSPLNWMTNFEEAVQKAKKENKPIVLFFTGSDWCGWCHRLENEALNTTDFSDAAGDKFVFVLVDFPLKSALDPKTQAQNKELQKKYDVKGFPTVILINSDLQQMGITGYRPGGGKSYGEHLIKMTNDFNHYKERVSGLDKKPADSKELQTLFVKAQELCRGEDANRIIKMGMQGKKNRYFLLERFRFLADEGQIHDEEAQTIRQKLLALDPKNNQKTHCEVAVIEFEAYSEEMEKEGYAPEIAVAPLVAYIERFGDNDTENSWRFNMIIAQVFLDKGKTKEALKHAKAAHAIAPDKIQGEILAFIQNIQTSLVVK